MSDHERPCGCLFNGYEVVSQCIYHTGRQHLIESLQREKAELQSIADAAGMDAERAITRADKAELDLKCLQESTVDAKAYQALQRENEAMRSATNVIQQQAAAITPEMRERIRTAEAEALKHLEHGIWEVKDIISDLRWNRRSTQIIRDVHGPLLRDLLGEQG